MCMADELLWVLYFDKMFPPLLSAPGSLIVCQGWVHEAQSQTGREWQKHLELLG